MEEEDKQYLSQVGMYLADLFYNQKNINMKKETLEEAAARYTCGWGEDDDEKAFIAGAKWQQEQMEKLKDFDTWKEWKNL
jgi:hypothetical protein